MLKDSIIVADALVRGAKDILTETVAFTTATVTVSVPTMVKLEALAEMLYGDDGYELIRLVESEHDRLHMLAYRSITFVFAEHKEVD